VYVAEKWMKAPDFMRPVLPLVAALTAIAGWSGVGLAVEPQWPAGQYKYVVIDQDLKDVLTEFGRNAKLSLRISDAVGGKRVRGEVKAGSAEQFFKDLCASYGLVWYYDGAVVYVNSESEVRTELIDLGRLAEKGVGEKKLIEKLESLGAADHRYSVKSSGDNLISVSGPPAYVAMVKQTLTSMARAAAARTTTETAGGDDTRVRVFRGGS
jgi:type III secretion protein C